MSGTWTRRARAIGVSLALLTIVGIATQSSALAAPAQHQIAHIATDCAPGVNLLIDGAITNVTEVVAGDTVTGGVNGYCLPPALTNLFIQWGDGVTDSYMCWFNCKNAGNAFYHSYGQVPYQKQYNVRAWAGNGTDIWYSSWTAILVDRAGTCHPAC